MSDATVLVVLGGRTGAEACLQITSAVARILGHPPITVLHVRADAASTILPTEEIVSAQAIEAQRAREAAEDAALASVFAQWHEIGAHWRSMAGYEVEEIRHAASGAQLVILPHPAMEPPGHREALETALFDSRIPVLMVPQAIASMPSPPPFCQHVVVGWRDSGLSRHAVATFAPFLKTAAKVTVIEVTDFDTSFPETARKALEPLRTDAVFETVASSDVDIGHALLSSILRLGGDTLLIGAHRHNVLQDWLFGTVTRTVLHDAPVPVLLVAE